MIKELTENQIAMLAKYRDMGIEIGYSTHNEKTFDENLIREITDKHRVLCDQKKAENFFVFDSPKQAIEEMRKKTGSSDLNASNALYGNLDIYWLNFYNFFRVELGLMEQTEKMVHLLELTKHCGWMWFFENATIVTKKPVEVNTMMVDKPFTDYDGVQKTFRAPALHNLDGPSMRYADGFSTYHFWEYHIPGTEAWVATTPADKLDVKKVMRIKNTDLRSLALKKIGIEKVFDKVESTLLHEKTLPVGGKYELFEVDFGTGPEVYLKMRCPSKGEVHIEGVPPDCRTVDMALGWRDSANTYITIPWDNLDFNYEEAPLQT